MLPQQITFPHPPSKANSFPHTLFRTLCRYRKTQPLCNQANPNSFAKYRGGYRYPGCNCGTPGVGWPQRNGTPPTAGQPETISRTELSTFRMNTCKSVSKQTTLTTFRMNTYEKPGGRGVAPRDSRLTPCYSEGPSGRKYCVPLTGSCRRRSSCCKSALRSTKSISEVLITSRSEAAYRKKKCS